MSRWNNYLTKIAICICLSVVSSVSISAQFSRIHQKNNVSYRDNYQRLSVGYNYILEIRNGEIYGSGLNTSGQLGDGTNAFTGTAQTSVTNEQNFVLISTGEAHTLAIKANGTLWAWGKNNQGQLATGNTTNSSIPLQIGADTWLSVAAGANFSVAIKSDGTLWTWGENDNGQLGNGTSNYSPNSSLQQVGSDTNWLMISAGEKHVLALKANGELYAWGMGMLGQVGNGQSQMDNPLPVRVGVDKDWKYISAGGYFSTAIKANGSLYVWGDNYYNQVIGLSNSGMPVNIPTRIGMDNNWTTVAAGRYHILALKANGRVYSWGKNDNGSLGLAQPSTTAPNLVSQIQNVVQLGAGDQISAALLSNGEVFVWGNNAQNALLTANTDEYLPVYYSVVDEIVSAEAQHGFSSYTLYSNGAAKGWGLNTDYQLGINQAQDEFTPVDLVYLGGNNIALSSGFGTATALKGNGTLWTWGDGGYTGNAHDTGSVRTPVQIDPSEDWISIAGGSHTTAAIKANGTLWIWGSNYNGETGLDTSASKVLSPTQVENDSDWVSVSVGASHTIAIKADGTLWGWGRNYVAEAGGGANTADVVIPTQIGTDNDWVSVNARSMSVAALKANGSVWVWGSNGNMQLSNAGTTKILVPTKVNTGFIQVSLANWSGSGVKADGTLWGWGNFNTIFGELGMGDKNNYPTPTQIPTQQNVVRLVSGQAHRIVLRSDRYDVCTVGHNYMASLGVGLTPTDTFNYVCNIAPVLNSPLMPQSIQVQTQNVVPATIVGDSATLQLEAVILPSNANQLVTWSVVNVTGNATITAQGLVKGLNPGTVWAKVISIMNPNLTDSILIQIDVPVDSIKVRVYNNQAPLIQLNDSTLQLVATVYPLSTIQDVVWSVTLEDGDATIHSTGLLSPISDGFVWAKAVSVYDNTMMDSIRIEIRNQLPDITSLEVRTVNNVPATISNQQPTLALEALVYPLGLVNQSVTWSIIPVTGNATIDMLGVVSPLQAGTVYGKAVSTENNAFSDSILITIEPTISVEESEEIKLTIFPNPAEDLLFVSVSKSIENATVSIIDQQGRNVLIVNKNFSSNNFESLAVAQLPSGVYTLQVIENKNIYVFKFIKK